MFSAVVSAVEGRNPFLPTFFTFSSYTFFLKMCSAIHCDNTYLFFLVLCHKNRLAKQIKTNTVTVYFKLLSSTI